MTPKNIMNEITVILGIATGVLSVLTFLGGTFAYLRSSARKEYASERDINHLKNNIAQQSRNIEELWKQGDRRFDYIDLKLSEIAMQIGLNKSVHPRPSHEVGKTELD